MILLAILLLLTGSGGFAEGKCNLSEVKAATEVAENIIPIFKYMNPIVGIFDNDCRIDEILEVVHEISQKLDNLEILIRESTNQYKLKIEEDFKDMKTYSGDLEKFENITLRTYARNDLQETLREYHQQYFVNEGITEGTLFSQIAAFLKDKGNFEDKCDGLGVSVQQELIDYYQSIVSVEVKAIIVVHFKYYLLSNYFEIGSFTEEKNMFNSKNDHRKVEMESNFKKSLSTMTNLHFWHCYPGHIDDHTFLARVSQGVHFFEYDKISCNGELYDKEEFRMAIKNDPSHPSGFGLMYFSNAAICYSNENSERKYEWLGTNGGFFGQKTNCPTKVKNTEARNVESFFALCDVSKVK
uniref:Fibrinogen C-terminal domain-containing protein n=1 Tax=Megaselia scalaris TaxID=36166 RepID=T1GLZ2_MEGSC